MARNRRLALILAGFILTVFSRIGWGFSAEKLNFGTSVKVSPTYYLPMTAAEERGLWQKQGLQVQWVPFQGEAPLTRAVAGGHINIGASVAIGLMRPAARGIPIVIVAEMVRRFDWYFYVAPASSLKRPEDFKKARIGVVFLGGVEDSYGKAAARALGIEKEIRFLGIGGIPQKYAAIKAGVLDAMVASGVVGLPLRLKGELRELIRINDYLPKKWMEHSVFARKDFIKSQPEVAKRVVAAVLEGIAFSRTNLGWARQKMQASLGFSEEAARLAYDYFQFTEDGKIDPEAVKNIREFTIEYGLAEKDKLPAAEELFTRQFTG